MGEEPLINWEELQENDDRLLSFIQFSSFSFVQ